jgi:DNA-binding MarR family transcriptional regulator
LTKIEHQPSFVVKPNRMKKLSIPINELMEKASTHTVNELATLYRTNYGKIYQLLSKHKITPVKTYEPITKEVLEEVFEEPTTVVEAAEQLHVTPATVTHAIKRFGLFGGNRKPTVKSTFNGTRAFKVLGAILNNPEENLASIGRRFNVTREYVRQIRECGIAEGIIKQEGIEL